MEFEDLTCVCGRYFQRPAALSNHKRACRRTKNQMDAALSKAKDLWIKKQEKKRTEANDCNVTTDSVPSIEDSRGQGPLERGNLADPVVENGHDLSSDLAVVPKRPQRNKRLPGRFDDMVPIDDVVSLPDSDSTVTHAETPEPVGNSANPQPVGSEAEELGSCQPILSSLKDKFGVFRQYYSLIGARLNPDYTLTLRDISDLEDSCILGMSDEPSAVTERSQYADCRFGPYPNRSSFLLAEWYWSGSKQKSRRNFQELVKIIADPEFNPDDIRNTPWGSIDKLLGSSDPAELGVHLDAGWIEEQIEILVPFHRLQSEAGPQLYVIGTFFRRSIIAIIKDALAGPDGQHFHFEPFDLLWQSTGKEHSNDPPLRVYSELYQSRAFSEEHCRLQQLPREPGCSLPRSIIALMFSSDETHLTQYGDNCLWPLYMSFGNISKYLRNKPKSHHFHHVAYFISIPDEFGDFVRSHTGKRPTDSLQTFCGREALQAQWKSLLDDEFLESYAHGFVFECLDGVTRRLYPRILILSADYKEKANLTCIRQLGTHPCPRCLIKLVDVHQMGTEEDRLFREQNPRQDDEKYRGTIQKARKQIFEQRYAVKGAVDAHLDPLSLTPNENAFSARLSTFGFDVFKASVVDVLHDFEQGSWKAVFIHLVRILNSEDKNQVLELDSRYRQVPPYGRDTIRKFRKNISEMKGLAARDFEDILQCSIPAFEGLFPDEHNTRVLDLLFIYAHWHGLAKLRLHTDATLQLLDKVTTELGNATRAFQKDTCQFYETKELEREREAREKRQEKAEKKKLAAVRAALVDEAEPDPEVANTSRTISDCPNPNSDVQGSSTKMEKDTEFSLKTYKFHALGDYVETIRLYGTTDSYSTESGESEHRRSKARYARTNKKDYIKQMAQTERREARIRRIRDECLPCFSEAEISDLRKDLVDGGSLGERYHVSLAQSRTEYIIDLLRSHPGDPAIKARNFVHDLKAHLLPRACNAFNLEQRLYEEDSPVPLSIFFQNDRMYEHKVLRLNYTTYDLRRAQDFVNPRTSQSNIMLFATHSKHASPHSSALDIAHDSRSSHPFMYAKVMKIFHVNIVCTDQRVSPTPVRMDVLWVRWYQHRSSSNSSSYRLDEVSFMPINHEEAFGFVDPHDAIRCCHLLPVFTKGRKYEPCDRGLSSFAEDKHDWNAYYINSFVDRDMLMRYHFGLGIGHTTPCPETNRSVAREQVTSGRQQQAGLKRGSSTQFNVHPQNESSMDIHWHSGDSSPATLTSNELCEIGLVYHGAEFEGEQSDDMLADRDLHNGTTP